LFILKIFFLEGKSQNTIRQNIFVSEFTEHNFVTPCPCAAAISDETKAN